MTVRPVTPDTGLARTVTRAFEQQGNVDGRRLQARSAAYGIFAVRNCALRNGQAQELSVRYRASAALQGSRTTQVYSCGTTFRRTQTRPTYWSEWHAVKTGCVQATSVRSDPFADEVPADHYIPGAGSPDEVDDREERAGDPSPDEVDDGSGSDDSGDEFGDIYH